MGERIKEARKKRNLTQEELAERIGSIASYISNIERKNKCPSLALLRKIVKQLDVSYDYILMDDFDMDRKLEIRYNEMLGQIKKLDNKMQQEFLSVMENILISFKSINDNIKKNYNI